MRVALVVLWWRSSRHDPERAPATRSYIATTGVAQVGWVGARVFPSRSARRSTLLAVLTRRALWPIPRGAQGRHAGHPRHIAERYGLLVIITLGEVIIGTVAAFNARRARPAGWTLGRRPPRPRRRRPDARLLVDLLHPALEGAADAPPERTFAFGYGHIPVFGALAATGAGLHVAASLRARGQSRRDRDCLHRRDTLAIYVRWFSSSCTRFWSFASWDPFHLALLTGTGAVLGAVCRACGLRAWGWPGVPGGRRARTSGHDRRLRDRRPPAHRRGARAAGGRPRGSETYTSTRSPAGATGPPRSGSDPG